MISFASAFSPNHPPFFQGSTSGSQLSQLPDTVWLASQMGASRMRTTPSGYRALDRELPNEGWPASVLIELLLSQNGIGELRLLAPTLAALTQAGKTVILLAPPHIPFAPALEDLGIDLHHVILIQTNKPMDRIWAVEQTLKSASFGALLCWLPNARVDHLRRLQLAAGNGEGLCFVFRPAVTQRESSPAPLRIVCSASACGHMTVDIIKRRGPVFGQPVVLPLPVPTAVQKAFARQNAPSALPVPDFSLFQASRPVHSFPLTDTADHVVDRPKPTAIAARHFPTIAA